jgi:hypothetical protein
VDHADSGAGTGEPMKRPLFYLTFIEFVVLMALLAVLVTAPILLRACAGHVQ